MKRMKKNSKTTPKTNEEHISVRYGCIRFTDSYRFLSSTLDKIVRTLVGSSHKNIENYGRKSCW